MKIECTPLGPFETNCFLITADDGKNCAVVDAPPGAGEHVLAEIAERGLKLGALLLTHGHWDHMADAHKFRAAGATVYAHRDDKVLIEHVETVADRYRAMIPWLPANAFTSCTVDHWIDEGDTVEAAGHTWQVRHVPGHCPGSILFYCPEAKLAFPGDAIFEQSVGRTDLPGGSWPQLLASIRQKIYTLPKDTTLLPGHGGQTTVEAEIIANPYARPTA